MPTENPNFSPFSEIPSLNSFEQALHKLSSSPEELVQIKPTDIKIAEIKKSFIEGGYNLNLTEAERISLQEKQFRSLDSGRGIGVAAVLGREKAEKLLCDEIPKLAEGRGKIGGKEGTEGRGLRQFVADTIKLITTPNPADKDIVEYTTRINERVFKGYLKAKEFKDNEAIKKTIVNAFQGIENKTDVGEFSSIPPCSLDKLWAFILKK